MKKSFRYALYTILLLEFVVYGWWYVTSPRGRHAVQQVQHEIEQLDHTIDETQKNVALMHEDLDDWERYPFYHEYQARSLQYVHPDDELYMYAKPSLSTQK